MAKTLFELLEALPDEDVLDVRGGDAMLQNPVVEATDDLNMRGDSLVDLGEVRLVRGDGGGASSALTGALQLYEAKGNEVAAESTRKRLAELG